MKQANACVSIDIRMQTCEYTHTHTHTDHSFFFFINISCRSEVTGFSGSLDSTPPGWILTSRNPSWPFCPSHP